MIQANELRVGNWIRDSREDYMCKVLAIDSEHFFVTKENELYKGTATCTQKEPLDGSRGRWLKFLEPIPLSEELLLKCGFRQGRNEYGNTFHIMEQDGFSVRYTIEHWTKTESEKFKGRFHFSGIGKVEYLHQLQNLYFALTGEELEVKL